MNNDLVLVEPKEVLDLSKLNPEAKAKALSIANQIKIDDSQAVVTFGVGAQREISNFSDSILTEIRSKDTGYVGEIMTNLVLKVKELRVDDLSPSSFISKLPLVGTLFNSIKKFIAQYEKLSVQIERIISELDKARMNLLRDITLLDNMYSTNLQYLQNLDLYIAAGMMKIQELNQTVLPQMKAKVEQSNDPVDAQKFNDLTQFVNRFEKKVHDLKLSRMVAIQTAPQLRLIQNGDQLLVEKIQSSVLNTIPLWKNQIVIAITLFRQKKALELQREVSETTNDLLKKNAELLKESSIGVARESERGIVDIETLKKVNTDLITTLEETIKIQQEGRTKRQQVEGELVKLENDLKDRLKGMKNN